MKIKYSWIALLDSIISRKFEEINSPLPVAIKNVNCRQTRPNQNQNVRNLYSSSS